MRNVRAVSTLIAVLLMIISALVGGVLSYMFTIPNFIATPPTTTITITGIFFDKNDVTSFKIGVLNPSYSPTNATISRIAVSIKGGDQLYDITQTEPAVQDGVTIQPGQTINITCYRVQEGDSDVTWGSFASEFTGQTIIANIFTSSYPAANAEADLPLVRLLLMNVNFDPNVSFAAFNMTIGNAQLSEINLTVNDIVVPSMQLTAISPSLPLTVAPSENISLTCTGNWSDLAKSRTVLTISAFTEQGYSFLTRTVLPIVSVTIQNVTFDTNFTERFNVTVTDSAMQPNYVNLTRISAVLDNGTSLDFPFPSLGIETNVTRVFTINWSWGEYRGRAVNLTAYFLQETQTDTVIAATPPPIMLEALNQNETFILQDRTHFNITLQNHPASTDSINVTRIVVKETGETINGTTANPQLPYGPFGPGQVQAFYCNIAGWTSYAGRNLTLTVYVVTNRTSQQLTFDFTFTLPKAQLDITAIDAMAGGKNLNVTIQNLSYSAWNLTVSKVVIQLSASNETFEQTFPSNQVFLQPGDTASLICAFNWINYSGMDIIVTVVTQEGIQDTQTFLIP